MAGQRRRNTSLASVTITAIVATLLSQSNAFADEAEVAFDIESQELGSALSEFALQSGKEILFVETDVAGKSARGISGRYAPMAALELLLADSNLNYRISALDTVLVGEAAGAEGGDSEAGKGPTAGTTQKPLMMAQASAGRKSRTEQRGTEAEETNEKLPIEEIVVTGTNIRGIAPDSSPYFEFDRKDIAGTGFGTTWEFIQSLPQNFGGGANADIVSLPNDRVAGSNLSNGSSVNLRGIGSGSTLVLLNGNRLAPAGSIGDFADISLIPLNAVERIEVLPDGASAIYGADAIAGVVNFVLRDDFEGAESLVRLGTVTEGDVNEYRASQTLGTAWETGNVMASYEFYRRDNLSAEDKDFSADALLPNDLLPQQQSHNVLILGSQRITNKIELKGHGIYSSRTSEMASTGARTNFDNAETEQYGVFLGAEVEVIGDWLLDVSGSYHEVAATFDRRGGFPAQRKTNSELWSLDSKADGTIASLPGGNAKLAVGIAYREEHFIFENVAADTINASDKRDVFAAFGEAFFPIVGRDNRRPGIERLELSVAGRFEEYSDFGSSTNPKVGVLWSPLDGLAIRGTFGTSYNPPNLGDTGDTTGTVIAFILPDPASATGSSVTIIDVRANPNLQPETATTWTTGFDYNRSFKEGELNLAFTLFKIEYSDRIDQPTSNIFLPLASPDAFASVITRNPDPETIANIIADAEMQSRFINFSGGLFSMPGDEDLLLDLRLANLASTETKGIDFSASYSHRTSIGEIAFGISGTHIIDLEKSIAPSSPSTDELDTVFNPIDLRLRGHVYWNRDGWSANAFINYVDDYVDDRNVLGLGDVPLDSHTTVDLSLVFETGESAGSEWIEDTGFTLSVLNLFDREPPRIEGGPGTFTAGFFDVANADPLGRFIAFQITKRF